MALFKSLSHAPFAFVWGGQTVSRLGDSLYRIALAWWVLQKTGSAQAMGAVLVFTTLPMILLLLVGGVAVDRFPRPRVMLASDLLRCLLVGGMALLAFLDALQLWHIYLVGVCFGLVSAFFFPAYTALVPEITPAPSLPSANSLTSLSARLTGVAGPAIGAAIVAANGPAGAFALDALSFLVAALCLLPVLGLSAPLARTGPNDARRAGGLADLKEGLAAVMTRPWLWITILIFAFINIAVAGPLVVSLPFLVTQNLGGDVGSLGLLYSALSLGSVAAAVYLGRLHRLRRRGPVAYLAILFQGVVFVLMGFVLPLPVVAFLALIGGACEATFDLIWTNTLQEMVPRELLGRVSSIDALGSFAFIPVGYALAGWATDLVGAPTVFLIGGAFTVGLAALPLLHPAIRNLD